jgi:hypothetical protein
VLQFDATVTQNTPDEEVAMALRRVFLTAQQGHPVRSGALHYAFNSVLERLSLC